ncbi:MAG: 30S ribosomal protein S30e [Candidatus Hodarchaeota archaeon]
MPGSHGSLTKAGKVRQQTPKVMGRERHSPIPIVRNKKIYIARVLNKMPAGQKDKMRARARR